MQRLLIAVAGFCLAPLFVSAQTVVGVDQTHSSTPVKDSSMLQPPPNAKIAIVDWTDLECPACAAAFPVIQRAVEHYKVPLVHHDFLIRGHVWSAQAAVFARYLEDEVSPVLSTEYRGLVFKSQQRIASTDDLDRLTRQFMTDHGKSMPFVLDPKFRREIQADQDLGLKMGLVHTPTIFVVTHTHWIEVADASQIDNAIAQARAETAPKTAASRTAKKTN